MCHGPQFSLKGIMVVILAIAVPLGLAASGEVLGVFFLPPVVGACVGYLVKGWDGVPVGVFLAVLAMWALTLAMVPS